MKSRIHKAIYMTLALGALFGVPFLLFKSSRQPTPVVAPRIVAGSHIIPVTIADTGVLRERGLSGTATLAAGTGKLFIFGQPGRYGFWMKEMNYPIDIVWIDTSMHVIGVADNIAPETYPNSFYPPSAVRYVLEINATEAAADGLIVGTELQFEQ